MRGSSDRDILKPASDPQVSPHTISSMSPGLSPFLSRFVFCRGALHTGWRPVYTRRTLHKSSAVHTTKEVLDMPADHDAHSPPIYTKRADFIGLWSNCG